MSCDLRAPGWLARHPMVGVIMFVVGALLFSALGYELKTNGPMVALDLSLANRLHAAAVSSPPGVDELMTFGFFLGKEMVEIIGAILVLYFLHKRYWAELAMIIVGLSGAAGVWFVLTRYFGRVRPVAQMGIVVHEPSFPSGHAAHAVLCFGLLAYLFLPKMPSLFWKWVLVMAAILTMLFIGFSRVFQGGHYLSDVLAGYSVGIAWAGLVYTILESFAIKRKN
ncbi:MAG: phosphatase PAP2 family protein [Anaerolineales bacterium]